MVNKHDQLQCQIKKRKGEPTELADRAYFSIDVGPISSVSVLGQTMIIINDVDIAFELMEKRGNVHSGRPRLVFGGEM